MTNFESEGETTTKEVKCNIIDTNTNNYTLDCSTNENIEYNLQSATSIVDKEILIINFANYTDKTESVLPINEESNIRYHSNKSSGIKAGAIVGIILACVIALIAIIIIIICLKRKKDKSYPESSIMKINIK